MGNCLVFDLNNLAVRSWATGENLHNSKGINTGALFYMLNGLKATAEQFTATSIILAVDSGYNPKRFEFYPDYKIDRRNKKEQQTEEEKLSYEDFKRQKDLFFKIAKLLRLKTLTFPNTEADDIIGYIEYLTRTLPEYNKTDNTDKVICVSSDKDFVHLVSEKFQVWSPIKKILYTTETTNTNIDLMIKCLEGDKGDSISSVKGIGEKTIQKVIEGIGKANITFDDIESYCQVSTDKKVKLIAENIEIVKRNNRLINLKYDDPMSFVSQVDPRILNVVKVVLTTETSYPVDWDQVVRFCYEQEFRTIYTDVQRYFEFIKRLK